MIRGKKLTIAILTGVLLGAGWSTASSTFWQQSAVAEAAATVVTVDQNASGPSVYPTIQAALDALKQTNASSSTLKIKAGTYREKLVIDIPNLTVIGDGAEKTTIIFDDAEGTELRPGDTNGNKTVYGMECATVKITKNATGFQASGITFANDFPTEERRADKTMKQVQAFAATVEADKASFYQCRFLGRQDTLYANAGRQYYKDCYIEGDVDFIFGQASAAVFEACEIKSLMREVKDDGKEHSAGYVTAPSTLASDKGFLFYKCHLISNIEAPHYALLGRPWHPSSETREVNSAATFRECVIDTKIKAKAWNSMKNKFGEFQPQDNRLYEYKNTGKWALTSENRRQLTDAEAVNYTPSAFLGDWTPAQR